MKLTKLKGLEIYSQEIILGEGLKLHIDFNARFTEEPIEVDIFVTSTGFYCIWNP